MNNRKIDIIGAGNSIKNAAGEFRDLVRGAGNVAAVTAVGLVLAAGPVGTAIGSAAHENSNKEMNISHRCESAMISEHGGVSAKREIVCIRAPLEVISKPVYPGQKMRLSIKIRNGSGDYSLHWKLNRHSVGKGSVYAFSAENNSNREVTDIVTARVYDLSRHIVLNPDIVIRVRPKQPKSEVDTSTKTTVNSSTGVTVNVTVPVTVVPTTASTTTTTSASTSSTTTTSTSTTSTQSFTIPSPQPASQYVTQGQTATITEPGAVRRGSYSYEWFETAPNMSGSKVASDCINPLSNICTFNTTTLTVTGSYEFSVLVRNAAGQSASSSASVVVYPAL
ncbi:MAG: hypothetical protein KGH64_03700 [Candidatus Micrarchaeota archaeon]|nr:hypothetical protein [Candidatus Micrarchaeota archaeon]MDE1859652.1 hypothetical protein [Candidatus Micrarchaeota archaeon]